MKCLFFYDYTGIMAQPWLDAGHECILVDGQHMTGLQRDSQNPRLSRWGLWVDAFSDMSGTVKSIIDILPNVDFIFGFPECTDLAVSGATHFKSKREKDPDFQNKAIANALLIEELGKAYACPWAFENPVSVISTKYRKFDHTFHPYEYGKYLPLDDIHPSYPDYIAARDAYPKKTCIWAGNGFIMPDKKPLDNIRAGYSDQHLKLGGKSLKTKNIRSATPRGFAKAVAVMNIEELQNKNAIIN